MNRYLFTVCFILTSIVGSGQDSLTNKKSIFRLRATVPILNLGLHYERFLSKQLSLNAKSSISTISFLVSSAGGATDGKTQIQIGVLSSVEARWFYNIKRRESQKRPTSNYSGWYLGLEPFILTNSIAAINTSTAIKNGSKGVFINLGFQKQADNHFFTGGFVGFAPTISPISEIGQFEPLSNKRSPFWIGYSVGYVF